MLARLLHSVLAVAVLLSATGVSASAHYCGGQLVDWGVLTRAKTCGMPAPASDGLAACTEATTDGERLSRVPCCRDTEAFAQLDILDAEPAPRVSVGADAESAPDAGITAATGRLSAASATLPRVAARPPPRRPTSGRGVSPAARRARLQVYRM